MLKSLMYAFVAAVVVYGATLVIGIIGKSLNNDVFSLLLMIVSLGVAGYVGYKAKIMLNVKEGKTAVSGLFFGLLGYIFCVVFASMEKSSAGTVNVTFMTGQSVAILIGALIAGKKTA